MWPNPHQTRARKFVRKSFAGSICLHMSLCVQCGLGPGQYSLCYTFLPRVKPSRVSRRSIEGGGKAEKIMLRWLTHNRSFYTFPMRHKSFQKSPEIDWMHFLSMRDFRSRHTMLVFGFLSKSVYKCYKDRKLGQKHRNRLDVF